MVLVGGVRQDLPVPYGDVLTRRLTLRGSRMYTPATVLRVWRTVEAGLVDLGHLDVHTVGLDDPAAAIRQAAGTSGLAITVLIP